MANSIIVISHAMQRHLWAPLLLSGLFGILFPVTGSSLRHFVLPVLGLMFFMVCLKVDLRDVVHHLRRPWLVVYVLTLYLLIVPAVLYTAFRLVNPEFAVGMLLLSAMPPGMTAPAFTDMLQGRTSLAMALTMVAVVISPVTVSALLSLLTRQTIEVDMRGLFSTLVLINVTPLMAAEAMKRNNRLAGLLAKTRPHYGSITVLGAAFIIYVAISRQAQTLISSPLQVVVNLAWLYLLFIILHLVGYFVAPMRSRPEKVALAVSKAYMNNALATGIAVAFFSPHVAFLMALSEIPWSTCLGPFKYMLDRTALRVRHGAGAGSSTPRRGGAG